MLAIIGLLTIIIMLTLIMTKKMQTLLALILIPSITVIIAGYAGFIPVEEGVFTIKLVGTYITKGITSMASTGVMFIFAILFFGILTDAGTFDPVISKILKVIGKDPVKICVGTIILACLTHLDGAGATTFLITIPAMLPLYKKLGMKVSVLASITALGAGVMNILPWGGPTIRSITVLESSVDEIFTPMIIPMIGGLVFIFLVAIYLGRQEKKRLGDTLDSISLDDLTTEKSGEVDPLKRPKLFLFNILLIVVTLVILVKAILPPAAIFMISTVIALLVNYPDIKVQKQRVDAHAVESLMMASMLFAAGAFVGIMQHSGMLTAMSDGLVSIIPESLGRFIPVLVGIFSMPASLVFDTDSYYYGVMPVLAQSVQAYGIAPAVVARASIIGQMTTGFPVSPLTASTFLLVGLSGVDLADHQKSTLKFAFLTTLVMLVISIVVGAIPV